MGMVMYFMAGMGSCVCSRYRRNEQSNLRSCVSRRDIHSNFHRYICRGGVKNSKFFSYQFSFPGALTSSAAAARLARRRNLEGEEALEDDVEGQAGDIDQGRVQLHEGLSIFTFNRKLCIIF